MTSYFYCPRPDMGVRTLVATLGCTLVRNFDGMNLWLKREKVKLNSGDNIICWGDTLPEFNGVRVLNSLMAPLSEFDIFTKFRAEAGLPAPAMRSVNGITPDQAKKSNYLARSLDHSGGLDLLVGCTKPAFYMSRYVLSEEARIHSFRGRAIRAGVRVPRDGFGAPSDTRSWTPEGYIYHPHIRNWAGGWRLKYDDFKPEARYRSLAHAAIQTLGLSFGSVDIGKVDGTPVIVGVNLNPDLADRAAFDIYAKHLTRWLLGDEVKTNVATSVVEGDIPF